MISLNNTNLQFGKKFYRLNKSLLVPGDVILEVGRNLSSKVIKFTDGNFSHAMLYLGDGQIIEAIGDGVIVLAIERVLVMYPGDLAVYRLPSDILSSEKLDIVRDLARSRSFCKYDMRAALRTKMGDAKITEGKFFCSQLISYVYQQSGIELVNGREPAQITPNMLASVDSNLRLAFAASEVEEIYPKSKEKFDEYTEMLDRHKSVNKSLLGENRKIEQEVFDKFSAVIKSRIKEIGYSVNISNMGDIIYAIGSYNFRNANNLSDGVLEFLDKREYFDLGVKQFDMVIQGLRSAYLRGDIEYIRGRVRDLPDKDAASTRWSVERDKLLMLPFRRSVNLRLSVMYNTMVDLVSIYRFEVETLSKLMESKYQ